FGPCCGGETASDGHGGRRFLATERVGQQVDERVDRDRVLIGVVSDDSLPAAVANEFSYKGGGDDVTKPELIDLRHSDVIAVVDRLDRQLAQRVATELRVPPDIEIQVVRLDVGDPNREC